MRIFYRDAGYADARSSGLQLGYALVVVDGVIEYLGPLDDAPTPDGARVFDAGGTTIVPSMVDSHSHITLPGGSHWIERIGDSTADLLEVAEHNGEQMVASGTKWARDVGSPRRHLPDEPDERALGLSVRDSWRGRAGRPYIRAAGTWITKAGSLPPDLAIEVAHADGLVEAVEQQLDEGADLVKLYLDGPDRDVAPWSGGEVARAVSAAHNRGAKVTAHATNLAGARSSTEGGVDSIEHGSELDVDVAEAMAAAGIYVVPTLAVLASFKTFAVTTTLERFVSEEGRAKLASRTETAFESVRIAHRAGVPIAAGTDFGGGSLRANQMAWEVSELARAGLEPWEALAAATWRGGDLLDEAEAGRLRAGGPADFFLVHGNPLADPASLWRVWRVS